MKIIFLLVIFISAAFVYSSDKSKILYSESKDKVESTYRYKDYFINKMYQRSGKSAFTLFLTRHKERLIVSGIGLAALVISGIFNKKAESQYQQDKDLYEKYSNAPKNSDFTTLWNEYKQSADKTDRYLNLRGILGTGAGVIGASLVISIIVEGNF